MFILVLKILQVYKNPSKIFANQHYRICYATSVNFLGCVYRPVRDFEILKSINYFIF